MKTLEQSSTGKPPPVVFELQGESVREQYDSLKQQADGLAMESLFATLKAEAQAFAQRIGLAEEQVTRILRQFDLITQYLRQNPQLAEPNINAMIRYFLEGKIVEYESNTSPLRFLQEERIIRPGQQLLDLGAGPGSSVELWNAENKQQALARGIDISMSFVMMRAQMMSLGLIDAAWEELTRQTGLEPGQNDVSMSNLTLDRVRNPGQMIRNMIASTRVGGKIAIGTLLPIIPEDDGEGVEDRIIYTPEGLRIVPGEDPDVDMRQLREYIESLLQGAVEVSNVPIQMNCSDGPQDYPNFYVFSGSKTARSTPLS